ncbi:hypothetical protein A2X44_01830 [candidate division CPR3 bacterium GWF2_35_18]|uniref:ATP synthase subunit alpha n=1 Tax=candidate division CPR3 bacterium GW2011_GWF2_35_18 TaxID=1618350 RepID=A0A0G0E3N4_UNCC3|nr:MAG: ATP synthase subunit alpha [candidate division CPR3 bacterium GW2011_GWF2_35_18]KKP86844.1 MAG: ATP synthase subunit alpha [candidate division CPR3 bacterium GW2011_GWE2_35_7]OGB62739.1 MAG: hypothetical protein A2X44_01830 [candidate division CPR3 bacterium GWF2_35_18]OGB65765.1 MAG: hypothetical protein A2250_02090 [candidate division CPR3 bacterium RIFOXYA2_FULL_35_13]OGB76961.1 MAG: hypothetical protein A2476_02690 [candidate division CPR3 bacterium RIFOXYC2_FULL_35_7]OGB79242.1 MA
MTKSFNSIGVKESVGRVESIINEVCIISGLESVALNNVVQFSSGVRGIVLGFTQQEAQIILLGNYQNLRRGELVKIISPSLKINVSEKLLGRIISPLGEPLDNKGEIEKGLLKDIEGTAKKVNERKQIITQLNTGYILIDSQIPIGKGQRELFIGEKKIKKSDVAAAIIANQTKINSNVASIFVTIDAESTHVKRRLSQLYQYGAFRNTIVILSRSSDPASLNYIAPMTGMTIAETLAGLGKDVLIVFDNLTAHAKVYRQLSLLLNRPPGREAYPGDIFYLHTRLLERCGSFSDKVGNGSITAIPIVETQSEEFTDFITTNLMAITDGHILFRQSLANKGIQPAIDIGYSVTRIGGKSQPKLLRELSDKLKTVIIRYHEVEKFISLGTEIQKNTYEIIELGKRIDLIFHQSLNDLLTLEYEIGMLYLLVSKKILMWNYEVIAELKLKFHSYSQEDSYIASVQKALSLKSLDKSKEILESVINDFIKDPKTPPIVQKTEQSEAEKETIVDLLKESTGDQYAVSRNIKK